MRKRFKLREKKNLSCVKENCKGTSGKTEDQRLYPMKKKFRKSELFLG